MYVRQILAEEGADQGCVVEFNNLALIGDVKKFCQQYQTVVPSESMTREIVLTVRVLNQKAAINLEEHTET